MVAEKNPVIQAYDQEQYGKALRYNERDLAPALENFTSVRAVTTQLLRGLGENDWSRQGWHTDAGLYTAEAWLRIYAAHAHDHAAQIDRLRAALGAEGARP